MLLYHMLCFTAMELSIITELWEAIHACTRNNRVCKTMNIFHAKKLNFKQQCFLKKILTFKCMFCCCS